MKTILAIGALSLAVACSPAEEAAPEAPASDGSEAGQEQAEEASTEAQAPADPSEGATDPTLERIAIIGTIDEIVLDGEEPMVVVSAKDGSNYLAVAAPGQIDTILDNTRGIGGQISLDCQASSSPPEDGYVWMEDCKLA